MLPHHRGNRLRDGLCPLGVEPDVAPWVTGELGPLYSGRECIRSAPVANFRRNASVSVLGLLAEGGPKGPLQKLGELTKVGEAHREDPDVQVNGAGFLFVGPTAGSALS